MKTNSSAKQRSAEEFEQMALPLSESEERASRIALNKLHPGNRLRLMFGQPLLPQPGYGADKQPLRVSDVPEDG